MNFNEVRNIHFIGIGGIGMSALARYFKYLGKNISGYDKTSTSLTKELEKEGMTVYYDENIDLLPETFKSNPGEKENLVVFTPAIPKEHVELQFFEERNVRLWKRSEILGEISKAYPTIAIGGTHGKTTTTSLLTFIALTADKSFASFVGGINENFKSNLVLNGDAKFVITEADEYDRSFLRLKPLHAILTSMDADHLDIYGQEDSMVESFREFASLVPKEGKLLIHHGLKSKVESPNMTYGLSDTADYYASDINYEGGSFRFNFQSPDQCIENIELFLPGYHNLENAVAAIAMATILGIDSDSIIESMANYKGVKRRFEYHINRPDFVYIDDYAHHPTEIKAVVSSLRKMYPGKKITGIFQPHLFSRTRDLAEGFAKELSELDEVILLEIYPAREKPIPGITSSWLLERISVSEKVCYDKTVLPEKLNEINTDVLVTLGAGDIDQMVPVIKNFYS